MCSSNSFIETHVDVNYWSVAKSRDILFIATPLFSRIQNYFIQWLTAWYVSFQSTSNQSKAKQQRLERSVSTTEKPYLLTTGLLSYEINTKIHVCG